MLIKATTTTIASDIMGIHVVGHLVGTIVDGDMCRVDIMCYPVSNMYVRVLCLIGMFFISRTRIYVIE